jgi:hypothetical protein
MLRLGMLRIALLGFAACVLARAEGFSFTIGSPVASQEFQMKTAAFVFRTEGCADPAKPQITATAEGIVKGARRSLVLKVLAGSKPNVYAVFQQWPAEGEWVVDLKGTCASTSAGAIVPIGPKGFIRESSKFFPRSATDAEVETSLKALVQGH